MPFVFVNCDIFYYSGSFKECFKDAKESIVTSTVYSNCNLCVWTKVDNTIFCLVSCLKGRQTSDDVAEID